MSMNRRGPQQTVILIDSAKHVQALSERGLRRMAVVMLLTTAALAVQPDSNTSLIVTPGATVNAGSVVTLTATVTQGGSPITPGSVSFCYVPAGCHGLGILGTAQLNSSGIATWKFVPGVGVYQIEATFQGAGNFDSSTSSPQGLTVTGTASYASATTLAATGNAGNYTLTATITAFGRGAPTGTASFVDTTGGNFVVASAALDPVTLSSTFTTAANSPIPTGNGVYFLATGDFDGDGIPDLAAANCNDGNVAVLLGKGDGTFQAPTLNPVGSVPFAVAVGDFNGDGFLDLAVANSGSASVSVLLGNGDGTFQTQVTYPTGNGSTSVAVADLNRDGNLDLVIANNSDGTASVLLGNGDGTFQTQSLVAVGNGPRDISVGDLNGDNIPDLAVANSTDSTVGVLLGNGDGTFALMVPYTTGEAGSSPQSVASGDFNGDGFLDLAVANYYGSTVSVLLGNGDGTFQAQASYNGGATASQITVGDFNEDGVLDIAVPNAATNTVTLLFGNGDGTFPTQSSYATGNEPLAVASTDLNGDGTPDLATANFTDGSIGTVTILLGQQSVTATASGVDVPGTGTQNTLAAYSGDSSRVASQSPTTPLSGGPLLPTASTIVSSVNPAAYNQSVTFTATVTAGSGTPTGSVTFLIGSTVLGVGALNGSSQASYTTNSLPAGGNAITAQYAGDSHYASSTSTALNEVVDAQGQAVTATALAASVLQSTYGTPVILTATVTTASGMPTGSVTFLDGTTVVGMGTLDGSSQASYTTSSLPVGTDTITAEYSGDDHFTASTSNGINEVVSAAGAAPTTTALTSSALDIDFGGSVTFTVVVMTSSGAPSGSVRFLNGTATLGTSTLNGSSRASFTTSSLPVGTDTITAVYSGDSHFAPSTSAALNEIVSAVGATTTATSLTSSQSEIFYGSSVTLTARVTPAPSGSQIGTVSFYSGTKLLASVAPTAGTATLTTSALAGGSDSITANYSGDASLAGSVSSELAETVEPAFTITGPSTPVTVTSGTAGSVNVVVTPVGGTFDGTVTMSATGFPSNMVATFTPATVTPHSTAAQTSLAWTFQSSQQASNTPASRGQRSPWIPLSLMAGACFLAKQRKSLARYGSSLAMLTILGVTLGLMGCAGGTGITAVPPAQGQTYTITITGSSGSLQRSTTMSLTVQ